MAYTMRLRVLKSKNKNNQIVGDIFMKTALEIFRIHHESIKRLIRANDVYDLIKMYAQRKDDILLDLAINVVNSEGISSITESKDIYGADDEISEVEEGQYLAYACEQSIQSTYTAFEKYLVNKYWELFRTKGLGSYSSDAKRFMGLSSIADIYHSKLNIDLKAFSDQQIELNEDDWFFAETPWHAIEILQQAKNEIAHEGQSSRYQITQVEDAFFVHVFIGQWVHAFDAAHT